MSMPRSRSARTTSIRESDPRLSDSERIDGASGWDAIEWTKVDRVSKSVPYGLQQFLLEAEQIIVEPLEGGPARNVPKIDYKGNKATVLYIGRIPHGFYEDEMEAFFKQFGAIKRLRIARNRKTGKSKHFGFIEFESPEVAKVVEECMHNYLMYEHLLQVQLVHPEWVHPKLWKGVNRLYKPLDWVPIERKRHDKERTLEEQQKLVAGILKRDNKRRKRIEAAGIDYECPEIVGTIQAAPKKIKFE